MTILNSINSINSINSSSFFVINNNNFSGDFYQSVITYFNSYLSSKYIYLVEMYPVHFMHLSFYDVYRDTYHQCSDINSFSHFFIPYQTQSGIKYKKFITLLKENSKDIYNMNILINSIDKLSFQDSSPKLLMRNSNVFQPIASEYIGLENDMENLAL
jgi:hypothetical protein